MSLGMPLENSNLSPFMLGLSLPNAASTSVLRTGASAWSLTAHWVSNYAEAERGAALVTSDGETFIGTLRVARGFDGFEVGVAMPYVRHSGGFLDSIINDWHEFFGLPQGGRDAAPDDRLLYQLREGSAVITRNASSRGVGDVRIHLARGLEWGVGSTAARLTFKLPTGDLDRLTGSGGLDATASIHHERALSERVHVGAWLGVSALSLPDDRRDIARQTAVGGGIVVRMNVSSSIMLKAQWASHSPIYDSALSVLRQAPGILSFGGSVQLSAQDVVDISVLENWPNGDASPDFSFGFTWRRTSL